MLDESQTGIKIAKRSINNLRFADDTTLIAESEEEPKNILMKKRVKSWLEIQNSKTPDHGIWSHHFMVNRRGKSGKSDKFYFLVFQNHCRWGL